MASNGHSTKTVTGEFGEVEIAVPRDRSGSFEPQLIPKHQRRLPGVDERILSLYARGMTNREIAAHLQEMIGAEVSPNLISTIPVSKSRLRLQTRDRFVVKFRAEMRRECGIVLTSTRFSLLAHSKCPGTELAIETAGS